MKKLLAALRIVVGIVVLILGFLGLTTALVAYTNLGIIAKLVYGFVMADMVFLFIIYIGYALEKFREV